MRQFLMLAGLGAMILAGCESAVLVNNRPEREPNWEATTPTQAEPETAAGTIAADEQGQVDAASTTQPADQRIQTQDVQVESYSN